MQLEPGMGIQEGYRGISAINMNEYGKIPLKLLGQMIFAVDMHRSVACIKFNWL